MAADRSSWHSADQRPRRPRGIISGLVRLVGICVFLAGIVLGCYAGFRWLQRGHSDQLLVEDVISRSLPKEMRNWMAHPKSWYGLRDIVVWVIRVPLFAFLLFLGFIILLAGTA